MIDSRIKELRTEVQRMVSDAKTLYADLEAKGDQATGEERQTLHNLIAAGQAKRQELDQLETLHGLDRDFNQPASSKAVETPGSTRAPAGRKSWGQLVVGSDEFKNNDRREMRPVGVKDFLPIVNGIERKALYADTDTQGGHFVAVDRQDDMTNLRMRPLRVINLVNQSQTNSDAVEYIEQTGRTNNAAVVPERSGGNYGLKPESDMAFALRTAAVKTIATWIAASRQILADAPQLRAMIDDELQYMVGLTLENQILDGDGTGANFLGMLRTSGIQTRTMHATTPVGRGQTTGDTRMTTIRRALTDIALEFYEATAIVMNPADAEGLEIAEYTGNRFANAFDPVAFRIWRVPVVETTAIPALTVLVGNFQLAATLWDRQQTEIRVGEPNDFFLRNAVAVLAELRAAFAVRRPKALERITLI